MTLENPFVSKLAFVQNHVGGSNDWHDIDEEPKADFAKFRLIFRGHNSGIMSKIQCAKRDFSLIFDDPAHASGLKIKIPARGFEFGRSATLKVPTASE